MNEISGTCPHPHLHCISLAVKLGQRVSASEGQLDFSIEIPFVVVTWTNAPAEFLYIDNVGIRSRATFQTVSGGGWLSNGLRPEGRGHIESTRRSRSFCRRGYAGRRRSRADHSEFDGGSDPQKNRSRHTAAKPVPSPRRSSPRLLDKSNHVWPVGIGFGVDVSGCV